VGGGFGAGGSKWLPLVKYLNYFIQLKALGVDMLKVSGKLMLVS
jgi:hypothetical protein